MLLRSPPPRFRRSFWLYRQIEEAPHCLFSAFCTHTGRIWVADRDLVSNCFRTLLLAIPDTAFNELGSAHVNKFKGLLVFV